MYSFKTKFIKNTQNLKQSHLLPAAGIILLTLCILFLPMGDGNFFGSLGDWYSQHVAVADSIRKTMIARHSLLPQWITLGAGSSIYDLAYYGVLRPDVILACFLHGVEMRVIVAGYMAVSVGASGQLAYLWLYRGGRSRGISFAGAMLLLSSTCFYQAHHQIMFVNYMPFLILALLGVDRLVEKGKLGLYIAAMFLVILHSFYYAPVSIVATGVYLLHRILGVGDLRKSGRSLGRFIGATFLSIGMAMVLLLPVALDILSTSKDGGSFAADGLDLLDGSLGGLLYSPYGCGMTLLCLYCLLVSLRERGRRFISLCLLAAMLFPAVSLVLNGFLYARAKILIPFVPLLVLVSIDTLAELREEPKKTPWIPLALCFVPALFSKWMPLLLIDGVILSIWVIWWRRGGKRGFWLILLVPLFVTLGVNLGDSGLYGLCETLGISVSETYLEAEDERQQRIPEKQVAAFASDPDYRYEVLADSFMNVNVLDDGAIQRTSIYSSISNSTYNTFYYDVMGNAISFNNRVALVAGKNPVFNEFMGIRCILAKKGSVPYGYQVKETYGDYVLAENGQVRPICYGSTELMTGNSFDRLNFWERLEALSQRTVVEEEDVGRNKAAGEDKAERADSVGSFESHAVKQDPETFFVKEDLKQLMTSGDQEKSFDLRLMRPLSGQILGLRFTVERSDGEEVVITIGGVKNKLSAASAPYPNGNDTFTFLMDPGDDLQKLSVKMTAGDYVIRDLEVYTLDRSYLGNDSIVEAVSDTEAKQAEGSAGSALVYSGSIRMPEDGWFVTSYPYRKGYEILVDGKKVDAGKVNTAFVGFPIQAGEHEIEIRFTSPGYVPGLAVSAVSWGLFALLLLAQRFGRRNAGEDEGREAVCES